MTVRIHEDEAIEELAQFDLATRLCRLTFGECWHVAVNLFGLYVRGETIDRWELISDSDLVRQVREMECGESVKLLHHRLVFSGGSRLDVLAERVSFQDEPPKKDAK